MQCRKPEVVVDAEAEAEAEGVAGVAGEADRCIIKLRSGPQRPARSEPLFQRL
jgi:hypothetical protein